jgi:hypothetical protein
LQPNKHLPKTAVFDPTTNSISIYHPLIINAGHTPATAPVVHSLADGAVVALWFGFNGMVLQLLDQQGLDTNQSPTLMGIDCVNGLPAINEHVFGQVSWCNTQPFFAAANASIAAGNLVIPDNGTEAGNLCPTSRSFEIVDAWPSDNVPTQYLLMSNGTVVQDTAANRAVCEHDRDQQCFGRSIAHKHYQTSHQLHYLLEPKSGQPRHHGPISCRRRTASVSEATRTGRTRPTERP